MANIFGILTTFILAAALFVANKNKSLYEEEIVNVISEKDRLSISQERLATAQKKLGELNDEIPVVKARAEELTTEGEEQRATNTKLETQLAAKTSESTRNRERISGLQEQIGSFGDLDQLTENLRSLQSELEALYDPDTGIPSLEDQLDRINARAEQIGVDNTTAVALLEGYARGESRPGMTTTIRSHYPNWGFVTLAAGGVAGIAGNSPMDVIRDNQIIAKLQVTAVEPNSATATIVPGSLAEDMTLAIGDTVVPGTRLEGN